MVFDVDAHRPTERGRVLCRLAEAARRITTRFENLALNVLVLPKLCTIERCLRYEF